MQQFSLTTSIKLTLDYCTTLLLQHKTLMCYLKITFQSAALRWTPFAGVKAHSATCTYLKIPFFCSKGYI